MEIITYTIRHLRTASEAASMAEARRRDVEVPEGKFLGGDIRIGEEVESYSVYVDCRPCGQVLFAAISTRGAEFRLLLQGLTREGWRSRR